MKPSQNTPKLRDATSSDSPLDTAFRIIDEAAPEDHAKLLHQWTPAMRRVRSLDRRDAAIREFAETYYGKFEAGRAGAMERDLRSFGALGYRRSAELDDANQKLMRMIINACAGRVPKKRQLQQILSGSRTPAQ